MVGRLQLQVCQVLTLVLLAVDGVLHELRWALTQVAVYAVSCWNKGAGHVSALGALSADLTTLP